jgi:hypothetical protein
MGVPLDACLEGEEARVPSPFGFASLMRSGSVAQSLDSGGVRETAPDAGDRTDRGRVRPERGVLRRSQHESPTAD